MNKEPMITITEPEVVSKTEPIENEASGVIIYNYDKSHVYYKGIDLGSFEELLNVKKYITDLQKEAELGSHYKHLYSHYKHLYSEIKKQKDDVIKYVKNNMDYYYDRDLEKSIYSEDVNGNVILRILGEKDEL